MNRIILSLALMAGLASGVSAQGLAGDWTGRLDVTPQMSLKLVFHITDAPSVTMDSPDQGAYGIEGEAVFLSTDSINFKVPKLMMGYAGRLVDGKIKGTFSQGGMSLPLSLEPGEKKAKRLQTPVAPFPYSEEEVTIVNNSQPGVELAGTLTVPENATAETPVVVMVTGSGQQNRDEELFEHRPFKVIADWLARNGVASLRYDDRGTGDSKGDVSTATTLDFASDAQAVVEYVRSLGKFGKVGMLGHSEGGLISYMLGAKPGMLDFAVSIAGPSVRGDSILVYQNRQGLAKAGIPETVAEPFAQALSKAFQRKIDNPGSELTDGELIGIYPEAATDPVARQLGEGIKSLFKSGAQSKWMEWFMAYSPAADIRNVRIPLMVIYGEKDRQVPPSLNERPMRALAPEAQVKVYPDLNHLMQHAETGDISEYSVIEETISPEVLRDITSFILSNGK